MIDSIGEGPSGPPDLKRSRRRASATATGPRADRLPPHSPEAEQGVLGCVLLSPNDCMGECIERLKGSAEAFYDLRHQTIYNTLAEMYDRREAIDVITLQQQLKNKQQPHEVGGISYLSKLPNIVASSAHLNYHLDNGRGEHLFRRHIQ